MERWVSRVAVVTGASTGIGARIAQDLVKAGLTVIALARRVDKIEENRNELSQPLQAKLHPKKCDVTNEDEVKAAFDWVEEKFGGTNVLINNAGCLRNGLLSTMDTKDIRETLDLNIMGIVYCTQNAFRSMKRHSFDGHVILINSGLGHQVPPGPSFNVYAPSKYAVTAMAEVYRQEFKSLGTNVKISSVSPGIVDTDIVPEYIRKEAGHMLKVEDVSNAVLYCLSTPPHVQVHELELRPLFM